MVNRRSETGRRVLLNRLYATLAGEQAWSEVRASAKRLVPGDGPTTARLMFVGEAPGATEDSLGKPFVGASGNLLGEMLGTVGLRREDVFVTNVVKYRPPNNRDPLPAEVAAGRAVLRREWDILDHPFIVALGRHARAALGVTAPVGEWVANSAFGWVLPLHHPAYGIYQRANRPMMFEQFKAVLEPLKVEGQ